MKAREFIQVLLFMISIILIPQVCDRIMGGRCLTANCFKYKFKTDETVAEYYDDGFVSRSTTPLFKYFVRNSEDYGYILSISTPYGLKEKGEKFVVLYEKDNPDNAMLLSYRPILPKQIIRGKAGIAYLLIQEGKVYIDFKYLIDGVEYERSQILLKKYFPLLNKLYKKRQPVEISVSLDNFEIAYVNLPGLKYDTEEDFK